MLSLFLFFSGGLNTCELVICFKFWESNTYEDLIFFDNFVIFSLIVLLEISANALLISAVELLLLSRF
jgi:hypothetical protein